MSAARRAPAPTPATTAAKPTTPGGKNSTAAKPLANAEKASERLSNPSNTGAAPPEQPLEGTAREEHGTSEAGAERVLSATGGSSDAAQRELERFRRAAAELRGVLAVADVDPVSARAVWNDLRQSSFTRDVTGPLPATERSTSRAIGPLRRATPSTAFNASLASIFSISSESLVYGVGSTPPDTHPWGLHTRTASLRETPSGDLSGPAATTAEPPHHDHNNEHGEKQKPLEEGATTATTTTTKAGETATGVTEEEIDEDLLLLSEARAVAATLDRRRAERRHEVRHRHGGPAAYPASALLLLEDSGVLGEELRGSIAALEARIAEARQAAKAIAQETRRMDTAVARFDRVFFGPTLAPTSTATAPSLGGTGGGIGGYNRRFGGVTEADYAARLVALATRCSAEQEAATAALRAAEGRLAAAERAAEARQLPALRLLQRHAQNRREDTERRQHEHDAEGGDGSSHTSPDWMHGDASPEPGSVPRAHTGTSTCDGNNHHPHNGNDFSATFDPQDRSWLAPSDRILGITDLEALAKEREAELRVLSADAAARADEVARRCARLSEDVERKGAELAERRAAAWAAYQRRAARRARAARHRQRQIRQHHAREEQGEREEEEGEEQGGASDPSPERQRRGTEGPTTRTRPSPLRVAAVTLRDDAPSPTTRVGGGGGGGALCDSASDVLSASTRSAGSCASGASTASGVPSPSAAQRARAAEARRRAEEARAVADAAALSSLREDEATARVTVHACQREARKVLAAAEAYQRVRLRREELPPELRATKKRVSNVRR